MIRTHHYKALRMARKQVHARSVLVEQCYAIDILYQISMVTHDPMTINKTKTKTFLKNDLFNQKKHNKPLQTHLSFTKGTQTRGSAIRYATRVVQSVAILKDQYIHIGDEKCLAQTSSAN